MNSYFTYESRDTLKSFTLFTAVKTISKLNAKHSDKYEDGKEMYQDSKRTCTAIVLLLNLLFGGVPVAVAVVVS